MRIQSPTAPFASKINWAFLTVILSVGTVVMDGTIVNIALPTIASEYKIDAADAIWVVNAYQLATVMALLPLSALGEIAGYRRIYLSGLLLFTLASLGCAASDTFSMLVAMRFLQGLGAAGVMSVNIALLRHIFLPERLGSALGWNTLVVATAATASPLLASMILSVAHWTWLFAINLPIGLTAWYIGRKALPENERGTHRFDWKSAVLSAAAFGLLMSGLDGIGHGLAAHWVAAQIGVAIVAGYTLIRRQCGMTAPLLPVDLLQKGVISLSLAASFVSFSAQMLAFVSLPFYLQLHHGFSKVESGFIMSPWPLAVGMTAPLAGRLADRHPAGILSSIGLVILAAGLILLAVLPNAASHQDVLWRIALCGVGFGFFQSPNNRTIISAAPKQRSGAAGGILSMARLSGQTMGATLVAFIFLLTMEEGTAWTLWIAACLAIIAAGFSLMRLNYPPEPCENAPTLDG